MLILKNPLTLQSISSFGIYSDSLGEKICGNYQTFGAAVTGEDLIHMTMQEPDIYVGIENNGPFLVDNQIHVDNQVRMELVNRLVNRLMLYPSPQFTYQDEVFVTTVLQKLGVVDVNEFMQQVKLHMEKNELTVSLINKYFDEGREFACMVSELLENIYSDRQELEIIKNEYQSDRYLHNEIFRRLMTAECSNTVYSYHNPVQVRERIAGSFHEIEWMRQTDRIQLSQLRENIFYQTSPAVFCDYSSYEAKPLAVNELTRQKIIGRMSAAILENIVNVAGYVLQYEYGNTNVWKNYSRIFYGSAENVLERFRYFQENGGIGAVQLNAYTVRMNALTQDELHLAQMLEFVNRSDVSLEGDMLYKDMRQNIVLTMLENQNLQKQLVRELQIIQQVKAWEQPDQYYPEERNQYIDERNQFEAAYRILRQKKNENYISTVMQWQTFGENTDNLEAGRALELLMAINEENALREHAAGIKKEIGKQTKNVVRKDHDTESQSVRTPESGQVVYELIRRYMESEIVSDVPLMENIELLDQINQHNLYMKQLLDSREPAKDTSKRVVVDRAQAREAALRALDHPELVLQEIYESAADKKRIPGRLTDQIPNEIEQFLSITDEGTRSYYERLMGYRSDDTPDTGSKSSEDHENKPVTPRHNGQGAASENLFLETIKAVLNTTDADTQRLYQQSVVYQTADKMHLREDSKAGASVLTQEGQARREELQKKVYSLLHWIDRKEHAYRTSTVVQAQEFEEQIQSRQIQHQIADIQHREDIFYLQEMVALEHRNTVLQRVAALSKDTEKKVQLVHKTREQTDQEAVEEVLETIQNSAFSRRGIEQKNENTLLTQRQIEEIRNELITQSREQITHMVERNMKTQVHEISDMVYLELERRLKNEQRRRGY